MASPEELARHNIDALLTQCGWKVQKRSEINLSAGRGIAITEGLLKGGDEADYLLLVRLLPKRLSPRRHGDDFQ